MKAGEDHHFVASPANPAKCADCGFGKGHRVHGVMVDHRGVGLETPSGNFFAVPAPDSDGESDVDFDPPE